ncbi:MAG TPA: hypothetical protein VFG29_09145 [Syntrophales bacterium]|nr:hypothetical protein [Syntrophales bacterium]
MDAISKNLAGILREGSVENMPGARTGDVLVDGRLLKPNDRIYDLVDVINDQGGTETKQDREIIVIDGRVYERIPRPVDEAQDLVNATEKDSGGSRHDAALNDEIIKRISEIAERIAKEIVPQIAERVIREEIDKLKR